MMPEVITQCPISPECTSKKLYKDDEGNIYRLDARMAEFVPHVCNTRSSEIPGIMYVGEWYNSSTKRTRYVGPSRMRRSAEIPPADGNYRKRGSNPVWTLVDVWISETRWKRADKSPEKTKEQ